MTENKVFQVKCQECGLTGEVVYYDLGQGVFRGTCPYCGSTLIRVDPDMIPAGQE